MNELCIVWIQGSIHNKNRSSPPLRATKYRAVFRWSSSCSAAAATVLTDVDFVPVVATWSLENQLPLLSSTKSQKCTFTLTCRQTLTQVAVGVSPAAPRADALPLRPPTSSQWKAHVPQASFHSR